MSTLVQTSSSGSFGTDETPAPLSLTVTGGNSIIVVIVVNRFDGNSPNCTVSDGNAYTLGVRSTYNPHGSESYRAEVHHYHNVTGGAKSIQVTSATAGGGNGPYGHYIAFEVSGLANALPDKTSTGGATSNSPATGSSGTLTQANNFGVAALMTAVNGLDAASESFVNAFANTRESIDRKVISATTALNVNWGTLDSSNFWCAVLAVYADAAAGGQPTSRRLQGIPGARLGGPVFGRGF